MTIVIDYDKQKEIKDIDSVDNLKDELLEFAGYFIPNDCDIAVELLDKGLFDDLIEEIEVYFVKDFFNVAKEFFLEIKKIYSLNTMDEIIDEFDTLNDIFKKAKFDIKYSVE